MAAAIESILELTTYKKAMKNEVLCQQGDAAIDFYIIVTGQCNVQVKGQDQKPVQVGQLIVSTNWLFTYSLMYWLTVEYCTLM